MIRRIAEGFHPDKIIVFGYRARETAGPDSNVDFLVMMPAKPRGDWLPGITEN